MSQSRKTCFTCLFCLSLSVCYLLISRVAAESEKDDLQHQLSTTTSGPTLFELLTPPKAPDGRPLGVHVARIDEARSLKLNDTPDHIPDRQHPVHPYYTLPVSLVPVTQLDPEHGRFGYYGVNPVSSSYLGYQARNPSPYQVHHPYSDHRGPPHHGYPHQIPHQGYPPPIPHQGYPPPIPHQGYPPPIPHQGYPPPTPHESYPPPIPHQGYPPPIPHQGYPPPIPHQGYPPPIPHQGYPPPIPHQSYPPPTPHQSYPPPEPHGDYPTLAPYQNHLAPVPYQSYPVPYQKYPPQAVYHEYEVAKLIAPLYPGHHHGIRPPPRIFV